MTTLQDILPSLVSKTESEKLKWDTLGQNSFVSALGNYAIVIQKGGSTQYNLLLTDENGATLEQFSSNILGDRYYELENLYALARRQALDIDKALKSVKDHLDKLR